MQFDKTYSGRTYKMLNGETYVINKYGKMASASVTTGIVAMVTLTGWVFTTDQGNKMYQTNGDRFIDLADGWELVEYNYSNYSASQAQRYVNQIIKNNQHILCNNLLCARFATRLTDQERVRLYELQQRLQERNDQLQNDGLCANQKTSYPQGYADLAGYLQSFMSSYESSIGVVISTTAIIVISAAVVASLSTAAYFAYRYLAQESENDVKWSDELTRTLTSKLTEEEYAQLKEETQGIVTKSKIKQSLRTISTTAKIAIAAGVGFIIYSFIMAKKQQ